MESIFIVTSASLAIAVLVWAVVVFNRLVTGKNQLREAWSGIEVQLKRRHDLVPALVAVVKGYQAHEQEVLIEVTRERAEAMKAGDPAQTATREEVLSGGIGRLIMTAEAYPDLKADGQFRSLVRTLVEIEDAIQYARRYYNGSARDMNNIVEGFPSLIVAKATKYQVVPFFKISSASERIAPDLAMQLNS